MATKWIDFKELRGRLDPLAVLAAYEVNVKVKGEQAQGYCPLPTHKGHDGRPKSPSFSVNLKRGIFNCFSCGASGNLIDLVCFLQGMNPANPPDIRQTAELLDERFPAPNCKQVAPRPSPQNRPSSRKPENDGERKTVVNAPLDFALKNIDPDHRYLHDRGFTPQTIQHFGLGFCSKGLMKDRIVIPLHDTAAKLIGYAGRVVDDELIGPENPRYRFPGGREQNGVYQNFQKSRFLYRDFEIRKPLDELIVVESFTACWWLWQHDFRNIVAVMGSDCSEDQGDLIVRLTTHAGIVKILTDGDDAGEQCAGSIFKEVAAHRLVKWVKLSQRQQPTDYHGRNLTELLR
jgi:DNA primase